jgi:isoquinoline 1-oxidoreductase subunit beta
MGVIVLVPDNAMALTLSFYAAKRVCDRVCGESSFKTAHSLSVQGYFTPLRTFGAQVRAVLLDNVARHWRVPLAELSTEPSVVVHAKSGRRIGYGEIVAFAEIPEVAPDIKPEALKKTGDFRLIGHDVMRVELPTKVNGSAKYAIDVQSFVAKSALEPGVTWRRSGKAWGFDSDKGLDAFAADARDLKKPTVEWYKQGDAEAALATAATRIEAKPTEFLRGRRRHRADAPHR